MNNTITIQRLRAFADTVQTYLRTNSEYRQASHRNPDRKNILRQVRNQAYKTAQEHNAALHSHLVSIAEPGFVERHARELIARWDARNHCYEQLLNTTTTGWHERPVDAIQRLDKAERRLKDQLTAVREIIQKIQTDNQ